MRSTLAVIIAAVEQTAALGCCPHVTWPPCDAICSYGLDPLQRLAPLPAVVGRPQPVLWYTHPVKTCAHMPVEEEGWSLVSTRKSLQGVGVVC